MSAELLLEADGEQRTFVCRQSLAIGRGTASDIFVPDPQVSRHHAVIERLGDGKYYLLDRGSANGTYMGSRRILLPKLLLPGDVIHLGACRLVFRPGVAGTTGEDGNRSGGTRPGEHECRLVVAADIRDYTKIVERAEVEDIACATGRLFAGFADAIRAYGGRVDKYMGDAVLASWPADEEGDSESTPAAMRAVLDMQRTAGKVSSESAGLPLPLRIGVGMNAGEAVAGHVERAPEYPHWHFDDAANAALRLEEMGKRLNRDVVIGEAAYRRLPGVAWENYVYRAEGAGDCVPGEVAAYSFSDLEGILLGLELRR